MDVALDQGLPAPTLAAMAYFVSLLTSTTVGHLGTFCIREITLYNNFCVC